MKAFSSSVLAAATASLFLICTVSAQFDNEVSLDFFDVDIEESEDIGFTEARNGFPPCNGFPEYRKIPINQAFYLGAHDAGSDAFSTATSCHSTQSNDVSQMLQDGIRYLDFNLCKNQDDMTVCSSFDGTPSTTTFKDILEKIFLFARENVEQFFILNIRSENVAEPINIKELETTIDKICKFHTEHTVGTDEFVEKECPFIYTHTPGKGHWPSMGELVNFDPDMAQWEGDGELVGVRTKFMITASSDVISTPGYKSAYITSSFWRSLPKEKENLKKELQKVCRIPAGGIGLELHSTSSTCVQDDITPDMLEDLLLSRSGCNLNDSPLNTFFTFISIDHYDKHLPYLQELERRMMDVNYAKWNGNYELLAPSVFTTKDKKVARDEL
ncbi:uncharacterized protein BX663DRAFT_555088 [Cokeromyces recurvatus]|uniref:uncharacterized protein n=1 Tax=Cokeromyces recurvatus TaxID=90255 RepID=UPI00222025FC|nr:uncharacterized protein BX663DRAFT_555088 [Cokeromyces recurvatus]KAI7899220.1 hypothetical protein BX663DRAFT_555088 [Cokeromyces recurvatus]